MNKSRFLSLPRLITSVLFGVGISITIGAIYYDENHREYDGPNDIRKAEEEINLYLSEIEKLRFLRKYYYEVIQPRDYENAPKDAIPTEVSETWPKFSLPNWNGESYWSDFSRVFDYLNRWNKGKALASILAEYKNSPLKLDYSGVWESREEYKAREWDVSSHGDYIFETVKLCLPYYLLYSDLKLTN